RNGVALVADAGVGQVRLKQKVGGDLPPKGADRAAHHQGLTVRVSEDALLDLVAAGLVGGDDPIRRRQRTAVRVRVQIFGAVGGVGSLDRQAVLGDHGEAELLDLGLVDEAVHGLGQHAVGDGEPDARDVAGRAAVAVLAVDVGFVGRASAGLGGVDPGGGVAGRAGGGLGRGGGGG